MLASRDSQHGIRNSRNQQIVASRVLPAFDSASRRRGLLGRYGFDPEVAMIIAPCSAIHTFFMRFPIDALFVARDGTVLKASESIVPWRMAGRLGAYAVVELAPGTIARSDTRSGDLIQLTPALP